MAHRHWVSLINTKCFSYVLLIQLKIRNHAQLEKALDRHYEYQAYGGNPFHVPKIEKSPVEQI